MTLTWSPMVSECGPTVVPRKRVTDPARAMLGSSRRSVRLMPDAIFADPCLAAIYDDIDGDRSDLGHYEAIVEELGARRVLDVGCGTGTFACRLAARRAHRHRRGPRISVA